MTKLAFIIYLNIFTIGAFAQFSTPGNGSFWDFDSLVAYSNGTVTENAGEYFIHNDVTIAAGDSFAAIYATVFFSNISSKSKWSVLGNLYLNGCTFTHSDTTKEWKSLLLDNGQFVIDSCWFSNVETAVEQFGGNLLLTNSIIQGSGDTGLRIGGTATAEISGNEILNSGGYGTHITSSGVVSIRDNRFSGNARSIAGRPAVFIYDASPKIKNNHIHLNHWQGVGVWQQVGVSEPLIESNLIEGNLTGITVVNASPLIRANEILNNKVDGDFNSGAGIFIGYGSSNPVITGNEIHGNHFGVAIVNGGHATVGDISATDENRHGRNRIFGNNFQGTVYDLTNETPNPVKAENNYWGTANGDSIAAHILDYADNDQYGAVDFEPYMTQDPLSVESEIEIIPVSTGFALNYPNPFNPQTTIQISSNNLTNEPVQIVITNILGQRVRTLKTVNKSGIVQSVWDGKNNQGFPVPAGIYIYNLVNFDSKSGRMILLK